MGILAAVVYRLFSITLVKVLIDDPLDAFAGISLSIITVFRWGFGPKKYWSRIISQMSFKMHGVSDVTFMFCYMRDLIRKNVFYGIEISFFFVCKGGGGVNVESHGQLRYK